MCKTTAVSPLSGRRNVTPNDLEICPKPSKSSRTRTSLPRKKRHSRKSCKLAKQHQKACGLGGVGKCWIRLDGPCNTISTRGRWRRNTQKTGVRRTALNKESRKTIASSFAERVVRRCSVIRAAFCSEVCRWSLVGWRKSFRYLFAIE